MRILIIGGRSSVGLCLKNLLIKKHEVFTAGKAGCDIHLDLSFDQENETNLKFDVVILTAAVFGGECLNSYINNINVNVVGIARAISLAQKVNAKHFILVSTMSIFQDCIEQFNKIYVITKRQSEEIAEFACNSIAMPLTILRPSQLYSDLVSIKKHQPFLYNVITRGSKNEEIIIHGSKNSKRNYLHIEDFVEIVSRVIEYKIFGKFNCVNTEQQTVIDVVAAVINEFHSKSKVFFDITKENISDISFQPDIDFYNRIHFKPKITLEKGLSMIVNYYA